MTTPVKSRLRVESVTSDLDALGAQPSLHLELNLVELWLGSRLESHDQNRLSIGCANEAPAISEQDAHAVYREYVVLRGEVFLRLFDDAEFLVVRTIDANLRRRDEARDIAEEIAYALARIGDDPEQTRRAVKRIVEAVEAFREKHVARHFATDGCVRLMHLLLDERVTRLPHHGYAAGLLHRFGQRLGRFDIEYDRLAPARPGQRITRVQDEQVVAPDYVTGVVDDTDPIGVAVERNSNVGVVLLYSGNQRLEIFRHRRIRMVIRKGAVALAEETAWLDAELGKKLRRHHCARTISAVDDNLQIAGQLPDPAGYVVDVVVDYFLAAQLAFPAGE